jgi:hypothetical protein
MEAPVMPSLVVAGSLAVCLVYWFPVRRWFSRWGATNADLARRMPGDADIAETTYSATLAVTIDARPEHIWPWLVQMGYQRGGLYSYDWLDRLFGYLDRPSASHVLPEFQHLEVGDTIPIGRGPGFPVTAIEPRQALVLGGEGDGVAWVWQFGLYQLDENRTRLVSRNAVRIPAQVGAMLFMHVLEPAAFIMTRRMLLGLKCRAETLASAERGRSTRAA